MRGWIVSWFPEKKWGFIHPDASGRDLFFLKTKIIEGVPYVGVEVEYKRIPDPVHQRPMADDVRVIK
jgi:cold shock CspA family protein